MEAALPFLIVCPLALVAGFVDAIAGGGGLISLPAFFMAGLPAHVAIATNKMSACMGTALATGRFIAQGLVNWRKVLPCVAVALAGSALGARLTLAISEEPLRWIMLVILPLTAFYVMRTKSMDEPAKEAKDTGSEDAADAAGDGGTVEKGALCEEAAAPREEEAAPRERLAAPASADSRRIMLISVAASLCIGVYDGFYGPGTGTFLMLAFTSLAGMALGEAAGATKVVNLTTNFSALVVFLVSGQVWLLLGVTAGLFNMLGAWLGVNMFNGRGAGIVKPVMLLVLAVFFVKTLAELLI